MFSAMLKKNSLRSDIYPHVESGQIYTLRIAELRTNKYKLNELGWFTPQTRFFHYLLICSFPQRELTVHSLLSILKVVTVLEKETLTSHHNIPFKETKKSGQKISSIHSMYMTYH